jgi:BirA family biotin operon repressor/biotin-[acetyl-CoA-carboxylase] ligase
MNAVMLRRLLDSRGRFVPLRELGLDREARWDELEAIEAYGFSIERHPVHGVACFGPAERLCPDQIEHDLDTRLVGRRISVWNRVSSTNDLASRASSSRANEGLVVLAEEQTAGRGRRGRAWSSPAKSSILMSVLLFPDEPLAEASWLTALGAVAVAEVVSAWTGRSARIKWPNDVRVEGKKIGGILVERGAGAVVGIGLNANLDLEDFPDALRETATSLRILVGSNVDRSELARALIRAIDRHYDTSRRSGSGALAASWRDRVESLGENVVVETPLGAAHGRLEVLDLVQGLVLNTMDGNLVELSAHQVLSIRPCPIQPQEPRDSSDREFS